MTTEAITEICIFLAAQSIAAVAGFFTLRTDVSNLKDDVREVKLDTKETALHVAGLPCRTCSMGDIRG
jgi:hypothetical protein